jgi:hypothetical protein
MLVPARNQQIRRVFEVIAIQNFGMLWERDKVDWGKPGARGALWGISAQRRRGDPVDFKTQTGIYVLYDEQRVPIWIGQASMIMKRLSDHRRDHLRSRWKYFTWFGFRGVNLDGALRHSNRLDWGLKGNVGDARNEIEAVLIQVLEPRLNRRGPNWIDSAEYLQWDEGEEEALEEEDE